MRWVCPLVLVCLMAASGARPAHADRRDGSHLDAAPASALVVARRSSTPLPDLLGAYVVAASFALLPPRPEVSAVSWPPALLRFSCLPTISRARGPPTA